MKELQIQTFDAVVVGTGAAGYNGACRIRQDGKKTVAIVTEGICDGTSRNTGSDKQTYYKLGLGGDHPDSVREMAENLFRGCNVDGDNALCEAALSVRCFMNLVELGVPFPVNRYGEYVGYKTDHDPYARATSAGPLTSKFMTEALEKQAEKLDIPVFDHLLAIEVLKDQDRVCGLLCLDKKNGELVIFRCHSVLLATGGPAGIYADSVYPAGHTGSTGLALKAGASLQNMTQWQYGLASVHPRWNVSGTYMQVLPRFVSVDASGIEREFLLDYFRNPYEALSAVFLKGYQWPFDSRKVLTGSSVVDLLVYRECVLRKRRVYLDYRTNPFGLKQLEYSRLSPEAYDYLEKAEACFGTPIERLKKMNQPAIDLYQGKGVDLEQEMLEIALCAQHHNGGISVDMWWQTEVPGLFAAGECAGTHGTSRPGGSALNAGQVGSLRAAQYISTSVSPKTELSEFRSIAESTVEQNRQFASRVGQNPGNVQEQILHFRRLMSDCAAAIRDPAAMKAALKEVHEMRNSFADRVGISTDSELYLVYKLQDQLLTQEALLTALVDYADCVGTTCGSALYCDPTGELRSGLEELFRFRPDGGEKTGQIQQVKLVDDLCQATWRKVRPLPEQNDFFESVWRSYRENRNIF